MMVWSIGMSFELERRSNWTVIRIGTSFELERRSNWMGISVWWYRENLHDMINERQHEALFVGSLNQVFCVLLSYITLQYWERLMLTFAPKLALP